MSSREALALLLSVAIRTFGCVLMLMEILAGDRARDYVDEQESWIAQTIGEIEVDLALSELFEEEI